MIIGAGWRPSWSTDFVAVQIAADFGIAKTIILGKPEYVYDKDPSFAKATEGEHQEILDAVPLEKLNWEDYLKLIPDEWSPGMHAPVDPVAARLARKENIEVIVAGGRDLANVKNILEGGEFKGTVLGQFIS